MYPCLIRFALAAGAALLPALAVAHSADDADDAARGAGRNLTVQLGPRPFFLVNDMTDSPLKSELQACAAQRQTYKRSDWSIGHRGAALQF
ncbi:MAG: hypothetical protein ABIO45_17130, partial [Burkholderiaceae bacterium]